MHALILGEIERRRIVPSHRIRFIGNAAGPLLPQLARQLKDTFGYGIPSVLTEPQPIHIWTSAFLNHDPSVTTFKRLQAVHACLSRESTVVLPSYGMTECMPISAPPQDFDLAAKV